MIDLVGNGKEVTLKQIKDYCSNGDDATLFAQIYNSWKNLVLKEATNKKFYEDNPTIKAFYYFLIYLLIVYFSIYTRVKKEHVDIYRKWNGLKKYLEDFGNFSDKDVLHINLWESYLVFATVFGIAEKLQQTMKVKIQNVSDINNIDLLTLDNWHFSNSLSNSLNRSVNYAKRTVRTLETINNIETTLNVIGHLADVGVSSMSSSGGRGGGSSFGGGGFGGGGSSGGRF